MNLKPIFPSGKNATIVDMENMTLESKLNFLRVNKVWKCLNKNEVLEEHASTWKTNGLSDLKYNELSRVNLNDHCVKVRVDLLLNNHWTDSKSGINDTSYGVSK